MLSSFFCVAVSFSIKRAFRASYYSYGTTAFDLSFYAEDALIGVLRCSGDYTTSK